MKEQLFQESFENVAKQSPVLSHAALGKGNLTFKDKVFTPEEVEKLAKIWVVESPIKNSDEGFTSLDGFRKYRPPKFKLNSTYADTGIQANFERIVKTYDSTKKRYIEKVESNLHLNVEKE